MKTCFGRNERGFTLVEMMLLAVVISMVFVMMIGYNAERTRKVSIDRAAQQMTLILNASLTYYLNHKAQWPSQLSDLQAPTPYVPTPMMSPWNTPYVVSPVPPVGVQTISSLLQVSVLIPVSVKSYNALGSVLVIRVPYGQESVTAAGATVTATTTLPGQNLNNATSINFAGQYHNGACVPVPSCPPMDGSGKALVPEIMLTPTTVSGTNDAGSTNVYPISSFTAYATSPAVDPDSCSPTGIGGCHGNSSTGLYWRVCLRVITSKGLVDLDATTARYAVVMAATRCSVQNEAAGDPYNVWGP